MSRNKFNKQAKTDFDTEHFSIGSPLLEKSNEPIDRINLPNSVSSLALLSTENSSKQINNKKMNETYSVQMQFKPFCRPSTQKQLLRNTSMVHFSSKNLKPSVPKKYRNESSSHIKSIMDNLAERNHSSAKDKSLKRFHEFKEKNQKIGNYAKYSEKSHFTFGHEAISLESVSKAYHSIKAVQK